MPSSIPHSVVLRHTCDGLIVVDWGTDCSGLFFRYRYKSDITFRVIHQQMRKYVIGAKHV